MINIIKSQYKSSRLLIKLLQSYLSEGKKCYFITPFEDTADNVKILDRMGSFFIKDSIKVLLDNLKVYYVTDYSKLKSVLVSNSIKDTDVIFIERSSFIDDMDLIDLDTYFPNEIIICDDITPKDWNNMK